MEQVDAFLGEIRDTFLGVRHPPLTAAEIRAKKFAVTRLRPGYDEEEVDFFLDQAGARLRIRCAECGAESAAIGQVCARCGAPALGQPPETAVPGVGGPGGSAAIAAARDAGSGPPRARRRYLLLFLACCLILLISIVVGVKAPALATGMGWTATVSVLLAVVFLVGFASTLSRWGLARVRQVMWGLVPIVSLTVLAWWPFLVVALIRLRARDWAVLAAYLAALAAEIVLPLLAAEKVLPPAGVTEVVWFALVLLVAVAATAHTLVAFRPGAELPSFDAAVRARAAARRQHRVMDAGGPEGWQDDGCLDHLAQPGGESGGVTAS